MRAESSSFEAFRSPSKPGPQFTAYHDNQAPRFPSLLIVFHCDVTRECEHLCRRRKQFSLRLLVLPDIAKHSFVYTTGSTFRMNKHVHSQALKCSAPQICERSPAVHDQQLPTAACCRPHQNPRTAATSATSFSKHADSRPVSQPDAGLLQLPRWPPSASQHLRAVPAAASHTTG
jgi:hypothetical protein